MAKVKPAVAVPTVVPQSRRIAGVHDERHFTVPELAELWGFSDDFVRELFRSEIGVLKVVRPEKMHKRRYVTLSIPESIVKKVHERLHGIAA